MKRALEWALWSPTNAAITVIGTLVSLYLGLTLVSGASSSTASSSSSATPTPSSTSTVRTPRPLPTLPPPATIAPMPTPTLPSVTPTLPSDGRDDPATPVGVTDKFMRVWLAIRDTERRTWDRDLLALSSGTNMAGLIRTIPEQMIPEARLVTANLRSTAERAATVEANITNGDTYTVGLSKNTEGQWRVVSIDNHGGGAE